MISFRSFLLTPVRLLLAGTALFLIALVIPGQLVLGTNQPSDQARTAAAARAWPEGADLLAAQQLTLPTGDFQWHITTPSTSPDNGTVLDPGNGVIIASAGALLVQINEVDTLRLANGSALTLHEHDRVVVDTPDDTPTQFLVIELLHASDAAARVDDGSQVGPLAVSEGAYTLASLNLAATHADDATVQAVLADAIRPGVSIIHDDAGIPDQRDPNQAYDLWIVALYPNGEAALTQAPANGTGRIPASAAATTPAPPATPTSTSMGSPTATATATATTDTTATPTSTPTSTPTVTPTATPTSTPTVTPTATPTSTPTPTPTMEPTLTPTSAV